MTAYSRAGFKWSINEILSLQREFELLGWDINQIADKHKRSPHAIIHRLDQEGFADYNVLYSSYYDLNSLSSSSLNLESVFCQENVDEDDEEYFCEEEQEDSDEDVEDESDEDYQYEEEDDDEEYFCEEEQEDSDDDEDDKIANLSQRVDGLEEGIFEIRDMIKKMMGSFLTQNSSCIGSCN
jgi:hypothetical protein